MHTAKRPALWRPALVVVMALLVLVGWTRAQFVAELVPEMDFPTSTPEQGVFLQLDGRFYFLRQDLGYPALKITTINGQLAWIAQTAAMAMCERPGGAPLGTSDMQLFYGASLKLLPLRKMGSYRTFADGAVGVAALTSVHGDVECLGYLDPPAALDPIFANGFQ